MGLVELDEKLYVRAPPLIDVLIRVPHDHQVPIPAGEDVDQVHLPAGAVLELIHLDVVQPLLPFLTDAGVRLQQAEGKADEIMEVQMLKAITDGVFEFQYVMEDTDFDFVISKKV